MNFHYNSEKGEVERCRSEKGKCPFGKIFETYSEAESELEKHHKENLIPKSSIKSNSNRKDLKTVDEIEKEIIEKKVKEISSLVKANSSLSDFIDIPDKIVDIFQAEMAMKRVENFRKFPHKTDLKKFNQREIDRIAGEARTKGMRLDKLLEACSKSEILWYQTVLPSTSKQNYYESVVKEFYELRNESNLKNGEILNLPSGGENSLFIHDGEIFNKKEMKSKKFPIKTKSLDLLAETKNGKKIYFVCKYTKSKGGAQDNQYADALQFISCMNKDSDFHLLLNLDGEYYRDKIKSEGKSRTEIVRNRIASLGLSEKVFVGDYRDCSKKIEEIARS